VPRGGPTAKQIAPGLPPTKEGTPIMTWNERVLGEPTAADLAAIEAEWPLIDAELAVVDAEIRILSTGRPVPLDWRRLRRAEHQMLAAWLRLIVARQPRADVRGAAS